MATATNVLEMLLPKGGWTIIDEDFNQISYDDGITPLTKKQFDDGFKNYDAWKSEQNSAKTLQREAILNRLGITAEEVRLLLS